MTENSEMIPASIAGLERAIQAFRVNEKVGVASLLPCSEPVAGHSPTAEHVKIPPPWDM